ALSAAPSLLSQQTTPVSALPPSPQLPPFITTSINTTTTITMRTTWVVLLLCVVVVSTAPVPQNDHSRQGRILIIPGTSSSNTGTSGISISVGIPTISTGISVSTGTTSNTGTSTSGGTSVCIKPFC
ncbi:hypothetical protein OTU49_011024, partial [Cherax quadricarinatus]